jgi:ubiquinone/menaquinone biosynthesis C-methylase UbiE
MSTLEETLHSLHADKILDVATGKGDFILLLKDNLGSFGNAIGVDMKKFDLWSDGKFDPTCVRFEVMDGARLEFEEGSFDLVSISNSVHHLMEPQKVFSEMFRVLKPGGFFVFCEMYSDRQEPTQLTHTLLHQWWGRIDSSLGIYHRSPYKRAELMEHLKATRIKSWEFFDEADLSGDPLDAGLISELETIIANYQAKTQDTVFISEGDELRKRVKTIGFHSAPQLFAIGRKD